MLEWNSNLKQQKCSRNNSVVWTSGYNAKPTEVYLRHFYLRNHFSYLSISISLFVIIFYPLNVNIFYDFDRKICKILAINYCCDALLNIL